MFSGWKHPIAAPDKNETLRVNSPSTAKLFRVRKSFLGTSRMTIRADLARRILPVPEALVIEADEYLFTLAAVMSDLVILQEPLTCYVIHGGNLTPPLVPERRTCVASKKSWPLWPPP